MEKNEERRLVPSGIVELPVPIERAVEEWEQYQELCRRLLGPEDMQRIGKREFRKKSGWRKLAKAFNITDKIIDSRIDKDEDGRVISADFFVLAAAPNGRTTEGWGGCSIWERAHEEDKTNDKGEVVCAGPCNGRKHFSNPDHDVPATAHTRAKNRAIADLIGAGEVSAEEISSAGVVPTTARVVRKKAEPVADPGSVVITFGTHKDKTIAELWEEQKGRSRSWLEWVKNTSDYKNPTVRGAAIAFLAEIAAEPKIQEQREDALRRDEIESGREAEGEEAIRTELKSWKDEFPQAEVKKVSLSQEEKWAAGINKLAQEKGYSDEAIEELLKRWADGARTEGRYQAALRHIEANAPGEEE